MESEWKPSDSERINKRIKIDGERANKLKKAVSLHMRTDWKPIKNEDVSKLEETFSMSLDFLFRKKDIPKPVKCIIEVTKGVDGLGKNKETMEFYFYLDPEQKGDKV